jgi:hypothetical protein
MREKSFGTFLREMNILASLTWPYEKLRNGVAYNLNNAADFEQNIRCKRIEERK